MKNKRSRSLAKRYQLPFSYSWSRKPPVGEFPLSRGGHEQKAEFPFCCSDSVLECPHAPTSSHFWSYTFERFCPGPEKDHNNLKVASGLPQERCNGNGVAIFYPQIIIGMWFRSFHAPRYKTKRLELPVHFSRIEQVLKPEHLRLPRNGVEYANCGSLIPPVAATLPSAAPSSMLHARISSFKLRCRRRHPRVQAHQLRVANFDTRRGEPLMTSCGETLSLLKFCHRW